MPSEDFTLIYNVASVTYFFLCERLKNFLYHTLSRWKDHTSLQLCPFIRSAVKKIPLQWCLHIKLDWFKALKKSTKLQKLSTFCLISYKLQTYDIIRIIVCTYMKNKIAQRFQTINRPPLIHLLCLPHFHVCII